MKLILSISLILLYSSLFAGEYSSLPQSVNIGKHPSKTVQTLLFQEDI